MPLPGRPASGRLLLGAAVPWWRRSRRRAWRWGVALGLAALAARVVQVQTDDAARTMASLGRTRTVVVARRDLETGHVVEEGDTIVRTLPVGALPDTAVEEVPNGRTVTAGIVAGEVLSSDRLAPDGVDGLAALVPDGRRAIAVPTPDGTLRLDVGDRVDVLDAAAAEAYADDDGTATASVVARRAPVIAVDERSVTIAVEADEAGATAAALARGTPVLALTGPAP